jgi:hypothetical protein
MAMSRVGTSMSKPGQPLNKYADGIEWTQGYESTTSRLKSVTDALEQIKNINTRSTICSPASATRTL